MSRRPDRNMQRIFAIALMLATLLTGCSNPISDSENVATEAALVVATATAAPPMPIITPTPVDPTAVAAAANETPGAGARPDMYVVAENDTLYEIAARFEVDIGQLVEVNDLSDPNDIFVGQELIIPPLE